jgi:LEA14-like dessication related protein
MRRIYLIIIGLISLSACTVGEQVRELNALRSCKFSIKRIENIDLAGVDVKEISRSGNMDLISMPGLAMGLLKGNIPLKTNLIVEITNPTANTAAINELDYKLLINQHEVVDGTINQEISVAAHETTLVPLEFTFDIYKFIANDSIRRNIQNFIQKSESQEPRVVYLTIRVKPGILIGGQLIKYPGFIDIEKTLDSELILSYDQLF